MLKTILAAALPLASLSATTMAQEPVVLEPVSQWAVEAEGYTCVLRRSFGSAAAPTLVELRRDVPASGAFVFRISSEEFEPLEGRFTATLKPGGIAYRPSLPARERSSDGRRWTVWWHDIREAAFRKVTGEAWDRYYQSGGLEAYKRAIETLEIVGMFERRIAVRIGPIDELSGRLNDCFDSVLLSHGIPQEDIRDNARPVEMTNSEEILRDVFTFVPPVLTQRMMAGQRTDIDFLIYLDRNADPVACRLTSLPRFAELESRGCDEIVEKGRFEFMRGERARPSVLRLHPNYRLRFE